MRQNDRKKENTSPKVIIEFDIYAILILDLILSTRFFVIKWFTIYRFSKRGQNKSSYFRVKLKRIKFELFTEPDLDLN